MRTGITRVRVCDKNRRSIYHTGTTRTHASSFATIYSHIGMLTQSNIYTEKNDEGIRTPKNNQGFSSYLYLYTYI